MLGTNYECIMVAYNLSETSKNVLNVAINMKGANPQARLIITHVIEEKVSNMNVDQEKNIETIQELSSRNIEADYELLEEGNPAESLCDFAEKKNADLIIVGNSSKHAIKELLLGTVAENLVKNAPCHVLVVK